MDECTYDALAGDGFKHRMRRINDNILAEKRMTDRDTGPVEENVAALILHLVQHQIHHRGQVRVQLSDAGVSPPQLDDFYLTYGRVPSAEAYWS